MAGVTRGRSPESEGARTSMIIFSNTFAISNIFTRGAGMTRRKCPRVPIRRCGMLTVHGPAGPATLVAAVLDMSDGGMRLRTSTPVSPETLVDLKLDDGSRLSGITRYCRDLGDDEFNIGVEKPGASALLERRKDPRIPSDGPALLILPKGSSDHDVRIARLSDVSRCGLGITAREAVMPGQRVNVSLGETTVSGVVRNCRPLLDGFRIGIAVGRVFKSDEISHQAVSIPVSALVRGMAARVLQVALRYVALRMWPLQAPGLAHDKG